MKEIIDQLENLKSHCEDMRGREPNIEMALRIAKALGVQVEDIWEV